MEFATPARFGNSGAMAPSFSSVPIFAGLNNSALEFLFSRAKRSIAPAGAVVFREGETGNRFFLIEEGSVRVRKNSGAPEAAELAVLRQGEFFGEMCILETLPRCATVETISETTLVGLSSMAFYELYQNMPDQYGILILNIARDLSRRLRRLDEVFAARH